MKCWMSAIGNATVEARRKLKQQNEENKINSNDANNNEVEIKFRNEVEVQNVVKKSVDISLKKQNDKESNSDQLRGSKRNDFN